MNKKYSIRQLIAEDPGIRKHIEEGIEDIKKSQGNINRVAEEYNSKYKKEIIEGTRKKQLMLEQNAGMSEKEVLKQHGRFIPTVRTPILNFLYFFLNENHDITQEQERNTQNQKYGYLFEEVINEYLEEPEEMEQFIYGNCTHKTFQTIKKLKRLSMSDNEHEASVAYIAALKMCKKFNLEFDKIPTK